jgi:hypothetical protein
MDRKLRNLPPDAVEASQVPVEGVDLPETDAPARVRQEQHQFVENEGLRNVDQRSGKLDSVEGEELSQTSGAAQRGRTA